MVAPTVHHLTKLSESQVNEAVSVCLRAFIGETGTALRAMTGDDALLDGMFRAIIKAGLHSGAVYSVTEGGPDDEMLSISVWFGPGEECFATAEQRAEGFDALFNKLSDEKKEWWSKKYGPDFTEFLVGIFGEKKNDCWWANIVATVPQHQRRGFTRLLIDTITHRAREDNVIVALCTSNEGNAEIYRRMGFKEVARCDKFLNDGFDVICLTLDPSA